MEKEIRLTEEVIQWIPYNSVLYFDNECTEYSIYFNGGEYRFLIENYPLLSELKLIYLAITKQELKIGNNL